MADKEKQLMELAMPILIFALGLLLVMGAFGLNALGMGGQIVGYLLLIIGAIVFLMRIPPLFKF